MKKYIILSLVFSVFMLMLITYKNSFGPHPCAEELSHILGVSTKMTRDAAHRERYTVQYRMERQPEISKPVNEALKRMRAYAEAFTSKYPALPLKNLGAEDELSGNNLDYSHGLHKKIAFGDLADNLVKDLRHTRDSMEQAFVDAAQKILDNGIPTNFNVEQLTSKIQQTAPRMNADTLVDKLKNSNFEDCQVILQKVHLDMALMEYVWMSALTDLVDKPPVEYHYTGFAYAPPKSRSATVGIMGHIQPRHFTENSWISANGEKFPLQAGGTPFSYLPKSETQTLRLAFRLEHALTGKVITGDNQ